MARHTESGKFMPGDDLGTYRGQMKHGAGVEHIKDALHVDKNPLRKVTAPHDGVQSVSTDAGRKPTVHDCATDCGPNTAANAEFNNAATNGPRMRPNVVVIPGR